MKIIASILPEINRNGVIKEGVVVDMVKLSAAMEDYLKTIYRISQSNSNIHVSDISVQMGVSKASVCKATDLLAGKGLVQKDRYRNLALTPEGLKQAELLFQKNNIIKRFLHEILNVDPGIAEKDACCIEHCVSGESFESIRHYLESRGEM